MASMTRCGTCVPPGPSRNAAGCPLTVWASEGNWARMWVRSRVMGALASVVGIGEHPSYYGSKIGALQTPSLGMRMYNFDVALPRNYFYEKGRRAETVIHGLATKTFLTDWCYPNPKKPDGKELCDLLVVFDDTAIIWQIKDLKVDGAGRYKKAGAEK